MSVADRRACWDSPDQADPAFPAQGGTKLAGTASAQETFARGNHAVNEQPCADHIAAVVRFEQKAARVAGVNRFKSMTELGQAPDKACKGSPLALGELGIVFGRGIVSIESFNHQTRQ